MWRLSSGSCWSLGQWRVDGKLTPGAKYWLIQWEEPFSSAFKRSLELTLPSQVENPIPNPAVTGILALFLRKAWPGSECQKMLLWSSILETTEETITGILSWQQPGLISAFRGLLLAAGALRSACLSRLAHAPAPPHSRRQRGRGREQARWESLLRTWGPSALGCRGRPAPRVGKLGLWFPVFL